MILSSKKFARLATAGACTRILMHARLPGPSFKAPGRAAGKPTVCASKIRSLSSRLCSPLIDSST
jgi:hypothetical protein